MNLPIDVLELIALTDRRICITFCLAFNLKGLLSRQKYLKMKFTSIISNNWATIYRLPNGYYHRENDQPAIIYNDGAKSWWYNGKLHRENDQPAIICSDGRKKWFYNDVLYRENDQPTVIYNDGTKE